MDSNGNRNRRRWLAVGIAGVVAGCGGSDDGSPTAVVTPPVALQQNRATCEALATATIAPSAIGEPTTGAKVTSATYVFAVPDTLNAAGTAITQGTPDYCRLLLDVGPVDTAAPVVKLQVNLPSTWNGKSLQFGGSGFNGTLVSGLGAAQNAAPDTALPITRGYMTLGTDSGHQVATNVEAQAFALNDEALTNFAYASYKKAHDVARQLAVVYYGKVQTKSYYMGGSEGGREGMTVAQRYPNDYDAIVAQDPVMNWTGLQTFGNYVGGIRQVAPGAWLGTKTQLVEDTVLAACDALDGIVDKVVSNYRGCKAAADPAIAALRCPAGNDSAATCLSDNQIAAVNAAHAGYAFTFPLANGITAYAGFGYGGEAIAGNWSTWMTGTVAPTASGSQSAPGLGSLYAYGNGVLRYFIARNATFNTLTYDPAAFQARVQQVSALMDATNPDLSAYFGRGGKLILREDLSDTAQSPFTGLNYFDAVTARLGTAAVDGAFRAYVAPGLPHTSSGIAAGSANAPTYGIPGRVDWLTLMENWAEKGIAPPDQITATLNQSLPPYTVTASKPLCRYPLYPKFVGTSAATGNLAQNYQCVAS